MRAVLALWRGELNIDGLFLARYVKGFPPGLISLLVHLQLHAAFRHGREVSESLLIGVHFPVNFLFHTAFGDLARTEKVEDDLGVFHGLVVLVLDQDLNGGFRYIRGKQSEAGKQKDGKKQETGLHEEIIAQVNGNFPGLPHSSGETKRISSR
jgi:hypothetical protein